MVRIENKKIIINKDIFLWAIISILLAFIALRNVVLFMYLSQVFMVFTFLGYILVKRVNLLNKYVRIQLTYLVWSATSILWSSSRNLAINSFISIIQIVMICCLISYYCDSELKVNNILKAISFSGIIMIVYLVLVTPMSDWMYAINGSFSLASDEGRIGYSIGIHPNTMGSLCAILNSIFIYIIDITKKKRYYFACLALIIILLFSKSRLSLIMLIMQCILYFLFRKKRKFGNAVIVPIIIVVALGVGWSIFNIPVLYNLIGFRLQGMIGIFNSASAMDSSSMTRMKMIEIGLDIFRKNPLLGIGSGNYAYQAFNYYGLHRQVYSHCNYVELLANIGLVGAALYYYIPFWSVFNLWRQIHISDGNKRKLCSCLFALLFIALIADIGKITYNNELLQIIYLVAFSTVNIFKREKRINTNTIN